MDILEIIRKKKHGEALSKNEIEYMISAFTDGKIHDYQMSAFCMAVYFNGMNDAETAALTESMARSGDMLDLSRFAGMSVDKHSTGGVGDKTSLVVGPIVAACGGVFAKMSGRGLGHTGGTVDKLEAFDGYKTALSPEEFFSQAERVGIALIGQTGNMTPADKKLYALRDVTETVDSIPLIVSSIMSKKIAAGAHNIVLDVKCGSGAFMKDEESARILAQKMVDIGKACGRGMAAIITDMDTPLGFAIGNALEAEEALALLHGEDIPDLREICLSLSAELIAMCRGVSAEEARVLAENALESGAALEKAREWIAAQGGNADAPLAKAKFTREIFAHGDGYISHMNAEEIGRAALELGAGRKTKEDKIDFSAGIVLCKKTGDFVRAGETLAVMHASGEEKIAVAEKIFRASLEFSAEKPEGKKLIIDIVR
jgi:pyrimidine-nucleoside phosphorylase